MAFIVDAQGCNDALWKIILGDIQGTVDHHPRIREHCDSDCTSGLASMVIIDRIGEAIGAVEPFRGRVGRGPIVVENNLAIGALGDVHHFELVPIRV